MEETPKRRRMGLRYFSRNEYSHRNRNTIEQEQIRRFSTLRQRVNDLKVFEEEEEKAFFVFTFFMDDEDSHFRQ